MEEFRKVVKRIIPQKEANSMEEFGKVVKRIIPQKETLFTNKIHQTFMVLITPILFKLFLGIKIIESIQVHFIYLKP